ncbi:MAG: hypothetical protein GX593_04480 [Actinomycetales bacterium]|nr:hypothetical protein [Actinomycetales bacterium]
MAAPAARSVGRLEVTDRPTLRRFQSARFWSAFRLTFVTLFGLGIAVFEVAMLVLEDVDRTWLPVFVYIFFGVLVAVSALRGLVARRRTRAHRVEVSPEASVEIVVDDFLGNLDRFPRASCVFGVNDRFAVEDLAPTSLHAHFLDTYATSTESAARQSELDAVLEKYGIDPGTAGALDDDARKRHPGGTVVAVPFGEGAGAARYAFLLVNSSRGTLGFTRVEEDAHVRAVWDFHVKKRHVSDEVVFSLVGTGESRRLGKIQSAVEIIDEYFTQREHDPHPSIRRLIISIHPETVVTGEVDLEVLYNYLDARAAVHRAMSTPA